MLNFNDFINYKALCFNVSCALFLKNIFLEKSMYYMHVPKFILFNL